jgi:FkbM family methyltransferase
MIEQKPFVSMLYELTELIKLFIFFIQEYGVASALLKTFIWVAIITFPPRRDTIVRLRNGYKLSVIPNDIGISSELRLFNTHEPLATKVMSDELSRGMVVVDIGSNIGYYVTLESKMVKSEGRVVAVEPDPINFSYLLKNITLNGLNNVTVVNKAITDRDGTVKFIRRRRSNLSKVLENDQDLAFSDITNIIQVQAVTLDNLIEQLGLERLDLIRMDIEGYEAQIINASENILKKYSPDLFIEIHQFLIGRKSCKNLLRKINSMGYYIKHFIPRNIDFELLYHDHNTSSKDIGELLHGPTPDVFSIYLTTCLNKSRS